MAGNILALTSVTLNTGASLNGRALARNGLVSIDNNNVTACGGSTAPNLGVGAPTLSAWMLVMLATLLAIVGFAAMRRTAK